METVDTTVTVVIVYAVYFLISLAMTIWVARTLYRNGRLFLVDAFHGDEERADAVNRLLVVGFYLMNIGFVLLFLKVMDQPTGLVSGIEYASTKLGVVMLTLGCMHFFNMYNFDQMRKKATRPAESGKLEPAIEGGVGAPFYRKEDDTKHSDW